MTNIPLRVLIVEDSPDDATLLVRAVRKGGFELSFERVETEEAMRSALADRPWDIILCDFRMPTFDGFRALAVLKEGNLDIPLILVSGAIGEDTAVEAMKAGASDYVMKSNLQRLIPAIERELKEAASRAEKKKAEEALRQNEDRFRHISSITADLAYSCIKSTNTDYSIDWMIGATERITGYSEDYIRGLGCWRSFVFDDDLPVFDNCVTGVAPGKTGSCELRLRHKNGNIVWVTSLAKCVLDPESPDSLRLYGGFVDITERKELEQRNLELAAIVESSDEAIISSNNLDGIITSWNSGAERIYGYKEAEVVGKPVSVIIPKDRQHEILKFLEVIKSGANIEHYETLRLTKDGKEIPVSVSISATKNKQGRIIGASSIACDITDRKRIEEELWGYREHLEELVERRTAELLESLRRFRDLSETTSDVVWEVDARGLLTYVSPRIRDILGYRPEDVLGKAFSDFMSHEEADRFADFFRSICLFRKPFTCVEKNIIHKDGQIVILESSGIPILGEDGQLVGYRGVARDITERKRAEIALREKTEDLMRSNKDLEQFAYVAAHDLREPLVAVGAYLKILERLTKNNLDDKGKKCIEKAINIVLRMDAMLQALLAYSRINLTPVSYEPTDCNACLKDTLSNLGLAIMKSGAVVTSDSLPTVRGNAAQIVQVFQNLIGNAIKFRDEGPPKVHIGCEANDSDYKFSVSDNGIGIDPPYLDRIFNMFERINDLSGPMGTGIGLSTCRKIVERHGGRIWVDSQLGKGSTFYFTLPKG